MTDIYINGQRLDLATDAVVTLNFKSNLFGAIDKITASNSYTVKAPKTSRNRAILDNPTAPAYRSTFRYKRHAAEVVQNGIRIIKGYAVLLDSSEDYELGLYWGAMTEFQAWVDADKSINELPEVAPVEWSSAVTLDTVQNIIDRGYGWAGYNYGFSNTALANIHPSVTAKFLFDQIADSAGFTYDLPDGYDLKLQQLAIPAIERVGSQAEWDSEALKGKALIRRPNDYYWSLVYVQAYNYTEGRDVFLRNEGGQTESQGVRSVFSTLEAEKMRVRFVSRMGYYGGSSNVPPMLVIVSRNTSDARAYTEHNYEAFQNFSTNRWEFIVDDVIDVSEADEVYLYLKGVLPQNIGIDGVVGPASFIAEELIVEPYFDEIEYPSTFSVIANLPDIKQTSFVNSVNAMLGLFVMPDQANPKHLHFVTLDQLNDAKSEAVDWSGRLIFGNDEDPDKVGFELGEYAQRNLFNYKEDEDVATNGDGVLTIANEALEAENEVVELPFSASDGSEIKMYELNDEGTEAETISVSPRIMRLTEDADGNAKLTFEGLKWPSLLADYYGTMERLLNQIVVITEKVRVNETDLLTLDYMRPVYLRQYGRYYGLVSLQVNGSTATAELVQLPETRRENRILPNIGTLGVSADMVVASDIEVKLSYQDGNGEMQTATLELPRGQQSVTSDTPAYNLVVESVTPSSDYLFDYVGAKREVNTIGIGYENGSDLYMVATKAVASEVTMGLKLYNVSNEELGAVTVTIPSGGTKVYVATITRDFGYLSIESVTPSYDRTFIYDVINTEI